MQKEDPGLLQTYRWCKAVIIEEDREEYATTPDGKRLPIGKKKVFRPSLELMRYAFEADGIPRKRWREAEGWVMHVVQCLTEIEQKRFAEE